MKNINLEFKGNINHFFTFVWFVVTCFSSYRCFTDFNKYHALWLCFDLFWLLVHVCVKSIDIELKWKREKKDLTIKD